jgi:hypothetical protein
MTYIISQWWGDALDDLDLHRQRLLGPHPRRLLDHRRAPPEVLRTADVVV